MSKSDPLILESVLLISQVSGADSQRSVLNEFAREVSCAGDIDSALEVMAGERVDLVIVDETMDAEETLRFLSRAHLLAEEVPIVVAARKPGVETVVRFVRTGAYDVLTGPLDRENLSKLLEGMASELSRNSGRQDRFFCSQCPPGIEIVGKSDGMVKALEMLRLVAESRCNPVLILGETGTGKELAAGAVHAWRNGEGEKFVAVNCAALTANLLESELFGHVKGAFTSADRDKEGLFTLAADGTIFLDEISEMPSDLQAKLLRVLQEQTFRKVGGTSDLSSSATVIASSNRDLLAEVKAGRFRRDLYYRLAVFPITLPALRSPERRDDITLLAEYFLINSTVSTDDTTSALSKPARDRLVAHDFPGNVRELRNVIDRALILSKGEQITPAHVVIETYGESPTPRQGEKGAKEAEVEFSLETAEREFILRALRETGWQRTRAAALLGITRATLHAKLKRYDIYPPGSKSAAKRSTKDSRVQETPA
ncbi:MAG: sigma-54-dependent transcriptional regulator [Planctomycetota bacterium]